MNTVNFWFGLFIALVSLAATFTFAAASSGEFLFTKACYVAGAGSGTFAYVAWCKRSIGRPLSPIILNYFLFILLIVYIVCLPVLIFPWVNTKEQITLINMSQPKLDYGDEDAIKTSRSFAGSLRNLSTDYQDQMYSRRKMAEAIVKAVPFEDKAKVQNFEEEKTTEVSINEGRKFQAEYAADQSRIEADILERLKGHGYAVIRFGRDPLSQCHDLITNKPSGMLDEYDVRADCFDLYANTLERAIKH